MFSSFLNRCLIVAASIVFAFGAISAAAQQPQSSPATSSGVQNLVAAAARFYELGQIDKALETATTAMRIDPNDYRPWWVIGYCRAAKFEMKEASEAFAKVTERSPTNKAAWYMKAYADRMRNAREDSIAAARKAIEIDPEFALAYNVLGESLSIGSKNNEEAIAAFRTALNLKPDLTAATKSLARLLESTGNNAEVEAMLRSGMEADPQKMAFRFELGRVLLKMNRVAEARKLWNERKNDKDNTFPNFITLLERAEKKKIAADNLAAAPSDPKALVEFGLMEMDGESWVVDGRQERAFVYFKKALEINPNFAPAQFAICKGYVQMADTFKKHNADLDRELAKLKNMDAKLAAEIEEYRKNYSGGLKAGGPPPPTKSQD